MRYEVSVLFQSTFPQGERQRIVADQHQDELVSIHVPARGTTVLPPYVGSVELFQSTFPQGERLLQGFYPFCCILFQSTFPQGERQNSGRSASGRISFNPRSRKGNDSATAITSRPYVVSIHVPARGTTGLRCSPSALCRFQSTFPQGERQSCDNPVSVVQCFNPRSRKGNDSHHLADTGQLACFNPRSRKGNDRLCYLTITD